MDSPGWAARGAQVLVKEMLATRAQATQAWARSRARVTQARVGPTRVECPALLEREVPADQDDPNTAA